MQCPNVHYSNYNNFLAENNHIHQLPLEDEILEKLRNCSLVPRTLSEFQMFVCKLVNDPISEAVILEVWKQIYETRKSSEVISVYNDNRTSTLEESQSQLSVDVNSEDEYKLLQLFNGNSKEQTRENSHICPWGSTSNLPALQYKTNGSTTDEEISSNDCEVIKVISLKKVGSENCDNSVSKSKDFGSDANDSDSNKSVEILEPHYGSKLEQSSDDENFCLIHGKNGFQNACGFTNYCEQSVFVSRRVGTNTQKDFKKFGSGMYEEQNSNSSQDYMKGKRKVKYRKLKTEVKYLKYLLVNLLMNVNGALQENIGDWQKSVSSLSMPKIQKECEKTVLKKDMCNRKAGNEFISIKKHKKKNMAPCKKFNSPVDRNTSKRTKSSYKKFSDADHSKVFQKFCSPSRGIPDSDNCTDNIHKRERRKFQWREIITETLKSNPGNVMQVEELKRKVVAKYYYHRGNISQNTSLKFFKYLHSTSGVIIDADIATYSNKQKKQVSSKSERKKEVVTKTVTTTREYKMT